MISSWTIYWILQLDSVRSAFQFLAIGGLAFAAALTLWNGASRVDTASFPTLCDPKARAEAWAQRARARKKVLIFAVPLYLVAAFLPSSRTMAAVTIIPAIANNETVQKEAGELYQLAKDGLRELVKPEKENAK